MKGQIKERTQTIYDSERSPKIEKDGENKYIELYRLFLGPAGCHEDVGSEPHGAGHHGPLQHRPQERPHLLPGLLQHRLEAVEGGERGGLQTGDVQGQSSEGERGLKQK